MKLIVHDPKCLLLRASIDLVASNLLELRFNTRDRGRGWHVVGGASRFFNESPCPDHCAVEVYPDDGDIEDWTYVIVAAESKAEEGLLAGIRYSQQDKDQVSILFVTSELIESTKPLDEWTPSAATA